MNNAKPTILFMGTPAFALASLKALDEAGYPILGVVTQPDTVAGRGLKPVSSACALYAREKNLPLFQPSSIKDEKFLNELTSSLTSPEGALRGRLHPALPVEGATRAPINKPDFIVVAAFGQFLPDPILNLAKIEIVNAHGSLLPAYRGAAPIQYSILKGEKETGVSIMRVIKKMDAGAVYSQVKVEIDGTDTTESLMIKCAEKGANLLLETLPQIVNGLKPVEQDETKITFSPSIKKVEGKINWHQKASQIDCQIRAFYPWPIAHTSITGKIIKIFEAIPLKNNTSGEPGTLASLESDGLIVKTNDGCLLVKTVQLEGKKKMSAIECARGLRLKPGDNFE